MNVAVTPSTSTKCERCWHYRDDVGADAAHPTICGRCVTNLFGAGETRDDRLTMAAKKSGSSLLPWLGIAAIVILLDQITKAMILRTMAIGDSHTITSFFNIVHCAQHRRGVLVPRTRVRLAALAVHRARRSWPRSSSSGCSRGMAASGCSAGRWR